MHATVSIQLNIVTRLIRIQINSHEIMLLHHFTTFCFHFHTAAGGRVKIRSLGIRGAVKVRIGVRIRFSVCLVRGYLHAFMLLYVVIVAIPPYIWV